VQDLILLLLLPSAFLGPLLLLAGILAHILPLVLFLWLHPGLVCI
jgi:hypothetical protein